MLVSLKHLLFWSEKYIKVQSNVLGIYEKEESITPSDFVLIFSSSKLKTHGQEIKLTTKTKGYSKSLKLEAKTKEDAEQISQMIQNEIENNPEPQKWEEPEREKTNESNKSIRICSYNVNFGCCITGQYGVTEESIYDSLKKAEADIILFQETTEDWEHYFKYKG